MHQVLAAGQVLTEPGVWMLHGRCSYTKSPLRVCGTLPARLPCYTDATSVGASQQDNMAQSLPSVMMAMPNSPVAEITSQ
jgi:hypothetical protein